MTPKKHFDVSNLPMDILFEICVYIDPVSLLQLARCSTHIRAVLMTKRAESLWRRARITQFPTLPSCPIDLSEPQYIALIFDPTCQCCGGPNAFFTHYRLRTRHCSGCYSLNIIPVAIVRKELALPFSNRLLPDLVLSEPLLPKFKHPATTASLYNSIFNPGMARAQILEVMDKYRRLGYHGAYEAQKAYIRSRKTTLEIIGKHAQELTKWINSNKSHVKGIIF
ncbi:hypothetical protein FRC02_000485 [Tulasnella sp. 418]|nr:hypothetical protein FRC02_000485 [Tulasnella sp. 418]